MMCHAWLDSPTLKSTLIAPILMAVRARVQLYVSEEFMDEGNVMRQLPMQVDNDMPRSGRQKQRSQ